MCVCVCVCVWIFICSVFVCTGASGRDKIYGAGKENGTPQASVPPEMSALAGGRGNRDSYVMVDGGGAGDRNSRPRNEIVFKPNVQPNVFQQVAAQQMHKHTCSNECVYRLTGRDE